ncbi:unnamed protein product, partial [Pylaiella littoralis]
GAGGGVGTAYRTPHLPLYPGSWADARELRDILGVPASGVTVLCVDPPASYTGDAFVRNALMGRPATVHVRAGQGYGSLAACLARGLGVDFMAIKLQMSAVLPGLGGDQEGGGVGSSSSSSRELADIRAVLETATGALEEIRKQVDDPRHHLPPVIVIDGLLGRIRAEEGVPKGVEEVLRWCWTITGGRRLAHVVLTAPQSMAVDGSLVRVKGFLNDGRLAPGMMRVVALNTPDRKVVERRFRSRFATASTQPPGGEDRERGPGERGVALCLELVHREGCAVTEEANEILRTTEGFSDDKLSASLVALENTLDGFALEAWRRVAAAVASTAALTPPAAAAAAAATAAGSAAAGPAESTTLFMSNPSPSMAVAVPMVDGSGADRVAASARNAARHREADGTVRRGDGGDGGDGGGGGGDGDDSPTVKAESGDSNAGENLVSLPSSHGDEVGEGE